MKEFLSSNDIKFAYLDITESLFYLKTFLKLRDNRPEFDEAKKNGWIGIPCIVVNSGEKIYFDAPDLDELRD
jgi:glutaredoxin-related protein